MMNPYSGSNFDDFLKEEGIYEDVVARASKRLLVMQIEDAMREQGVTKTALAERMHTSRSQVERLLDPDNTAVTLDALVRLAEAIGKQLQWELA
ncbi:MAG: XRE family transcriptional regulator [Chloroflexi bacterium]|nr:XRE family transcriptional regulator [Chloroflexota bacterium]